jgi:PPOX class probable F420-dependent enzyme
MIKLNSEFGQVVRRHLESEYVIWLTTIDSNLTPQPRPVWFIWEGDSFLIFSKPHAYKVKHIQDHPGVALHFNTDETGDRHVIVFTGTASIDTACAPAHTVPAYFKKYESGILALDMTPEIFSEEYSTAIRINPTDVRGWE